MNKFQQWSLLTLYNGEMARGGRHVRRALGIEWILHFSPDYGHLSVDHISDTNLPVRDESVLRICVFINRFRMIALQLCAYEG